MCSQISYRNYMSVLFKGKDFLFFFFKGKDFPSK